MIAGGDFNQTFEQVDADKYPVWDDDNFQAGKVEEDLLKKDGSSQQMTVCQPADC